MNTSAEYIRVATKNFRTYKTLADNAIAQVRDEDLHYQIDPEANSIAQIIQHMSGNAISRFTGFFTSDGEKPDRNRDAEFEVYDYSRAQLEEIWERGWRVLFDLLDGMTEEDLQDQGRGAYRDRCAEQAGGTLRLSCRTDRIHRQTPLRKELEYP